jgi:hypothetical protein
MNLPKRALREGEALCKFQCGTIVQASIGSCEMCCFDAIAERLSRFPTPVVEETKEVISEPVNLSKGTKRNSKRGR